MLEPAKASSDSACTGTINRSQLVLLQILITLVLGYQLLFSRQTLQGLEVYEWIFLGLMLLIAGLALLPDRLWRIDWVVGALVLGDTVITTAIIYRSGIAGSDLYVAFFLMLLVAAFTSTVKQAVALSIILCAVYGLFLFSGTHYPTQGQLLGIPVLGIMATFYGIAAERMRNDFTRRTFLEEQLRQSSKLEAVGRLAGGIAHDFNNLLTAIMGATSFLQAGLHERDPLRQEVEEISNAVTRCACLTKQLLAFGRRQMLQPKVLDLNTVVANVEQLLRRVIGEDIELITIPGPGLGYVKADQGQIEQVLMNLALNARDAMPRGGKLLIATANAEPDQTFPEDPEEARSLGYVMLAVTDTGVGMDAKTKAHIFEPFFTTKERGKGTGLGLATVYGMVKQSGGQIIVESEPLHGASFKIYLPRAEGPLPSEEPRRSPCSVLRPATILLVDDDRTVRAQVRQVLERNGHRVLETGSVDDAFAACTRHSGPISLLVSNTAISGISGPELVERLSSLHPEMKVLYLGGSRSETMLSNNGEPARGFLQRPFTAQALMKKVQDLLEATREAPPVHS